MKKILLSEAKKRIIESSKLDFPDFYKNEEFLASITHWIQAQGHCPPLMPINVFKQLPEYFSSKKKKMLPRQETILAEDRPPYQASFEFAVDDIPFPPPKDPQFTFIDLFAGIGGIKLPFQELGGKCVFSSEWNPKAKQTYEANFGEIPYGDITKINKNEIPAHDILLAGFPCQAFSIAGERKGFSDEKGRGNLFFQIREILNIKKPKAFLLENVKNLQSHDNGNTFKIIVESLHDLGYSVLYKILNSVEYGNVPQNRERIYIIGFRDECDWERSLKPSSSKAFHWPDPQKLHFTVRDLLEENVGEEFFYEKFNCYKELKTLVTNKDTVYQWRRVYVRENKNNVCPTLTANMGTGGHNVPLILDKNNRIRKLTPRECAKLQGFPERYKLPNIANSHLYKQFGNSVTVPVIKRIAQKLLEVIDF